MSLDDCVSQEGEVEQGEELRGEGGGRCKRARTHTHTHAHTHTHTHTHTHKRARELVERSRRWLVKGEARRPTCSSFKPGWRPLLPEGMSRPSQGRSASTVSSALIGGEAGGPIRLAHRYKKWILLMNSLLSLPTARVHARTHTHTHTHTNAHTNTHSRARARAPRHLFYSSLHQPPRPANGKPCSTPSRQGFV